jgi:hypothetical protein
VLRTAWILAAISLVPAPAAAGPPGLRAVAEEAAKAPAEQQVLGKEELSETKTKEPAPEPEPQRSHSAPYLVLEPMYIPGAIAERYPAPYGVASMGMFDSEVVPSRWHTRWRFGFVGGGGGLAADAFGPLGSGGLLFGVSSGRLGLDLRGQYTRGRFDGGVELAFENLQGLSADAVGRVGISEPDAAIGVNFLLLARLGRYDWTFRNPVQVAGYEGIRTVEEDTIRYRSFLAGLGVVPLRGWEWSLELTAAAGHQRFEGATAQGFVNDLFENGPVVELLAQVVYSPF